MAENDEFYEVERTLDYTVTQKFLVRAGSREEAEGRLVDFTEGTGWDRAAAVELGVVFLSREKIVAGNKSRAAAGPSPF